ncbi:hypothetical protein ACLKA6_017636 [Drosophila palustris]
MTNPIPRNTFSDTAILTFTRPRQTYRSNFVILNENTTTSRPSPYTTASRSTSSIAVHNSFTINLVHRRTQQLHDQPRPSPYTIASRSTSSITIHNGFTIVLV